MYNKNIATPKQSYPNPLPNQYVLGILQFCHKQMSFCYGCDCKFYIDGYPEPPSDLVIVSSMRRSYIDSNHQRVVSPQFSKVYYHFNYSCITVHNQFFFITISYYSWKFKAAFVAGAYGSSNSKSNLNLKDRSSLSFSSFLFLYLHLLQVHSSCKHSV